MIAGFRALPLLLAGALLRAAALAPDAAAMAPAPPGSPTENQDPRTKNGSWQVAIRVDAGRALGDWKPIWRFFGADEPNYATMKDGERLLGALGALRPKQIYFRAHNLLNTGDGTPAFKWGSTNVYTEDARGRPVYDWTVVDRIFDTYLARRVHPYVEFGFMPRALSTHPEPYRHEWRPGLPYDEIFTGWAYPPKDYGKWRDLAYAWARHCVERYGRAEVESWYWEVGNEPNTGYWKGTPEEWYQLYDFAVDGIRRALPTARVGGPHTAGSGGAFMDGFLRHLLSGANAATGGTGAPADFLAFHAKGQPVYVDGRVRMGIAAQLQTLDSGFRKIAAVPALRSRPIVIGESDPEGCAACLGPQLGYRAGTMYSSYTAASIARHLLLADRDGVNLEGMLTWAFEFEDQPYFAGQRVLATNGIDLPVLNVFRLLSRMGGHRLDTASTGEVPLDAIVRDGVRGSPDVAALASLDGSRLCILAWHYHDDDLPGPDAEVALTLEHLPVESGPARLTQFRIDQDHSNAFSAWKRMGSPPFPNQEQYARLVAAGQLAPPEGPAPLAVAGHAATLHFTLPRQGVALLVIDLPTAP